ncbi:MBOAT family O-acyltransferase [Magnetospirillum aberrantis]|uniref:Probable alginate O-acetylase AlgI n=1 Tax=Magnetospirillum aberrantis SpK TaxID=908842 RepID=A0A7C9US54_9PROT|nr:MBOAT family protein [Magnetospirillum aberrantis]NFV79047.1 MBOAT family protein [Magnetospirillum aberrantis SpK]
MLFNSPPFLLLFLPLSALLFFWRPLRRWRLPIVTVLSLLFYDISAGDKQLGILIGCIAWVYIISNSPKAQGNGRRLAAALVVPAAVLVYFKYAAFLLTTIGFPNVLPSGKGGIPAGISFYVFHLASFAIDRYRGDIVTRPSPATFATYVGFFPQLIAGPITRFRQVGENIAKLPAFVSTSETVWGGTAMFAVGMGAKLLLADPLMSFVDPLLQKVGDLDRLAAAYAMLGYSFHIYFDFYGYSMMAMGLGMAFGVPLPRNFDRPYLSRNPKEFWRRWHMTLSFWIRDYLYVPLGGNAHYTRNIIIVFAACGLWHGAGWNFIVWGVYHGFLVLTYSATRNLWDRLPAVAAQALTFALVTLGWPLFALDLTSFGHLVTAVVMGSGSASPVVAGTGWLLLTIAALVTFLLDTDRLARPETAGPSYIVRQMALAAVTLLALTLVEGSRPFIYFQF